MDRTVTSRGGEAGKSLTVDVLLKKRTVQVNQPHLTARRPVPEPELTDRLQTLKQQVAEQNEPKKQSRKAIRNQLDSIRQCNLDRTIEALSRLYRRKQHEQHLGSAQRSLYVTARLFLLGEIMATTGCDESTARTRLNDVLQ